MAWWLFMALISVQIIFMQYMVEVFLAEHYEELFYCALAMGFVFICSILAYFFFIKTDEVSE